MRIQKKHPGTSAVPGVDTTRTSSGWRLQEEYQNNWINKVAAKVAGDTMQEQYQNDWINKVAAKVAEDFRSSTKKLEQQDRCQSGWMELGITAKVAQKDKNTVSCQSGVL